MEISFTPEGIANIATLVAPGYLAIQAYSWIHAKADKDFSKTLVESIVFSILITGIYKLLWQLISHKMPTATNFSYLASLIILSLVVGVLFGQLRKNKYVRKIATRLGMPGPDDDFMRVQFKKLKPDAIVTVTLKSNEVFSGTPEGGSTYQKGNQRLFYFNSVAWYNSDRRDHPWDNRNGSVIVALDEVRYVETDQALLKD